MSEMKARLRRRLGTELFVIVLLTIVFFILFPRRPMVLDECLALFAVVLLILNAGFTKSMVWNRFPPSLSGRERLRRCLVAVVGWTSVFLLILFIGALYIGYSQGGLKGIFIRISNWHIIFAVGLYFSWALVQQTLFQFYLLGRLLILLPAPVAIVLTGVAFSMVHLPNVGVTVATAVAGIVWSGLYYRYRFLSPLAFSHALLGSALFSWVYGEDVVQGLIGVLFS